MTLSKFQNVKSPPASGIAEIESGGEDSQVASKDVADDDDDEDNAEEVEEEEEEASVEDVDGDTVEDDDQAEDEEDAEEGEEEEDGNPRVYEEEVDATESSEGQAEESSGDYDSVTGLEDELPSIEGQSEEEAESPAARTTVPDTEDLVATEAVSSEEGVMVIHGVEESEEEDPQAAINTCLPDPLQKVRNIRNGGKKP